MKQNRFTRRAVWICCLLFLLVQYGLAQTRTVTGRVTGPDSLALPNVSVQAKGTNTIVITDPQGNFTIDVPASVTTLIFTQAGFSRQEIAISGDAMKVTLLPNVKAIDEVVVVGYGTQRRKEVTSAVASVKAEDFNQGGTRSPLDLIQGKVAGLSVTRTNGNNPNAGPSIQLRGVSSMRGTTTPLIVVDGIPGGNLDLIQQDDIASFDILKDGSAAAIYGTRGNAGVILITTKKGRAGEPRYEYSTYVQREIVDRKPDFLRADEFGALVPESSRLGGNTDMYELLINRKNTSHYHNFAASGGSANTNYRASAYYSDAEGIAIKNNRRQYGGRLNINQRGLQDMLQMQMNLAFNLNKANLLGGSTGDFEQSVQRNPTAPVFTPDGKYLETDGFNNYNPIARLNQEISEREQSTFSADLRFTLEPVKNLKISAFGALIRDTWNDRAYRLRASRSSQQTYQGTGYASKSNTLTQNRTFEATIDYTAKLGDKHTLTGIAGYSYQYATGESFNVNNSGFSTDAFLDYNLGSGSAITNTSLPRPGLGSSKDDNTLIAFFGRVNYSYLGKYLLQGILRREGSSRFGANNKWGNFPAVSAGWIVSNEDFMKGLDFINTLKLRIGYGVTGNQDIPNYRSLILLGTGGFYLQDGVWLQTYGPSSNPNPNLRWEKKKELNLGLDFSVFNNRFSGSIDVYNRRTEDLLEDYNVQQPPFVSSTLFANVGTINNKGVEILLSAIPIKQNGFTWSVDLTGSSQRNKLISFSNELFQLSFKEYGGLPSPGNLGNAIRTVEGGPLGNFYGKRFAGFTDDGKWLFYKQDGSTGPASDISNEDLTVIGNGVPKYFASLTNNFSYKNFDLTIFLRGKFKFDILNTPEMYFGNKKWLPNNILRSAITRNAMINDDPQYSDYYLEKGDFVKLDNITLGYNVPLKNKYIRGLRVYVSARNVATITGYNGLDPELEDNGLTTGIDNRGFYPRTRSYAAGLNLSF
jgi:TonB-dependent starch-binding outer membrane protein SusC